MSDQCPIIAEENYDDKVIEDGFGEHKILNKEINTETKLAATEIEYSVQILHSENVKEINIYLFCITKGLCF